MIGYDEIEAALDRADDFAKSAPDDAVSMLDQDQAYWREVGVDADGLMRAAMAFAGTLRRMADEDDLLSQFGLASIFMAGFRCAFLGLQAEERLAA